MAAAILSSGLVGPSIAIGIASLALTSIPITVCTSSSLATCFRARVRVSPGLGSPMDCSAATATPLPSNDDVVVQYVVLRRDLIDTWPLGSVVTQGCHASVAAIWSHKDDPHTLDYCGPNNLDSMHKVNRFALLLPYLSWNQSFVVNFCVTPSNDG